MVYKMDCILVFGTLLLFSNGVGSAYAPTGCSFNQGNERATCDFTLWVPPLQESTFGPGDVYNIFIEQIDGTIPSQVTIMHTNPRKPRMSVLFLES